MRGTTLLFTGTKEFFSLGARCHKGGLSAPQNLRVEFCLRPSTPGTKVYRVRWPSRYNTLMKYSLGTLMLLLMFVPPVLAAGLDPKARSLLAYALLVWLPLFPLALYTFTRRP